MKLAYIVPVVLALMAPAAFADKHKTKGKQANPVMEACKTECPEANTEGELHSCITSKESDPTFKSSPCAVAHAKHEKEEKSHSH